jgi:hypothetical protein
MREIARGYFLINYLQFEQAVMSKLKPANNDENMNDEEQEEPAPFSILDLDEDYT